MANTYTPKFSFQGIDTSNIDPDRLPLGTKQQDCSLIAQVFERGCHATPSEAAIFATLTRSLQNHKGFALAASQSLNSYLGSPADSAARASQQANKFASDVVPNPGGTDGTSKQNDHILQAFNIGNQKQSIGSVGEKLAKWAQECIPCNLRLASFLELNPNIDLLDSLEKYKNNLLGELNQITDMLKNYDSFGDFCTLLNSLSFMCIPDLQRIIALLMSLFMLQVPKMDGMISLIQSLIAPLFLPIFMSLTTLLDQFINLVVNPLECVRDALNSQLNKLNTLDYQLNKLNPEKSNKTNKGLASGLQQLNTQLTDGIQQIRNKANFYMSQVRAFAGEINTTEYLKVKMATLQIVRMISFISAIIAAMSKGHAACSSSQIPQNQEIDNFFNNFVNPNSSFNISIDDNGQLHIDDKNLSESGNVLQFEGENLLEPTIQSIATQLNTPVKVIIPCKLEQEVGDTDKVNQWIAELNKT